MNLKKYSFLLIIVLSTLLYSYTLPNKILKKVNKEIKSIFEVKEFNLKAIKIADSINNKMRFKIGADNLFKIENNNTLIGYAYVDKAASKTDEFDYLILLDTNLIIVKTKVLIYREDYGGEIGSKRWLKQFIGKKPADQLKYQQDVIAISGATISAISMTNAVNQFLQNLETLIFNKVI